MAGVAHLAASRYADAAQWQRQQLELARDAKTAAALRRAELQDEVRLGVGRGVRPSLAGRKGQLRREKVRGSGGADLERVFQHQRHVFSTTVKGRKT